jgi:hypothetical protein
VTGAVVLFLVCLIRSVTAGFGPPHEAWFLQISLVLPILLLADEPAE